MNQYKIAVLGHSFITRDDEQGRKSLKQMFSSDPKLIRDELFPDVETFGKSGLTLKARDQHRWIDATRYIAMFRPDMVVVFAGGNNFSKRSGTPKSMSGAELFQKAKARMLRLRHQISINQTSRHQTVKRPRVFLGSPPPQKATRLGSSLDQPLEF